MSTTALNLYSTLADLRALPQECSLVIPADSVQPNTIASVSASAYTIVGLGDSAVTDLFVGEHHAVVPTVSSGFTDTLPLHYAAIHDPLAEVSALIMVTGETDIGYKLDVVGAFRDELRGLFFWG